MDVNIVIQNGFKKWLKALGYAASTVTASTNYVRDFFFYLKETNVSTLEAITPEILQNYYKHLQTRGNKRQEGGLSQNYITSNINALKRFSRYLQETGKPFFEVFIKTSTDKGNTKIVLSLEEVRALYKACEPTTLGIRDRAILSIYYGCGLRRSEGIALNVADILLREKRVYVRKGKNYKERYVPMTDTVKEDLEHYIKVSRKKTQSFKHVEQEALLLSREVSRMHGNSIINRLQLLKTKAGIEKQIGLHTLRHSIATHLLHSGMRLEEVSQFLGHSSLESTQIYTHITYE